MDRVEVIKQYYERRLRHHHADYEKLGWESPEAHQVRFDILCRAVPLSHKSLLDVGCGVGTLYTYLQAQGIEVDYTGVDILPAMIEIARQRYPVRFIQGDFLTQDLFHDGPFDVVFASGLFNLKHPHSGLETAFGKLFSLCRECLVVNLLHEASSRKEPQYCYYQPESIARQLRASLNDLEQLEIVEGYLPNDFTVVCWKMKKRG